jgi:hypothetical protein
VPVSEARARRERERGAGHRSVREAASEGLSHAHKIVHERVQNRGGTAHGLHDSARAPVDGHKVGRALGVFLSKPVEVRDVEAAVSTVGLAIHGLGAAQHRLGRWGK